MHYHIIFSGQISWYTTWIQYINYPKSVVLYGLFRQHCLLCFDIFYTIFSLHVLVLQHGKCYPCYQLILYIFERREIKNRFYQNLISEGHKTTNALLILKVCGSIFCMLPKYIINFLDPKIGLSCTQDNLWVKKYWPPQKTF